MSFLHLNIHHHLVYFVCCCLVQLQCLYCSVACIAISIFVSALASRMLLRLQIWYTNSEQTEVQVSRVGSFAKVLRVSYELKWAVRSIIDNRKMYVCIIRTGGR